MNEQKNSLKRLSINTKLYQRNHLVQLLFPTRSRIKLHQSQLSINKRTPSSLNEQITKLNQRAIDVQKEIEHNISSLKTQRLQNLTSLNEKTRDLEHSATTFEYSSSKNLKQKLNKTKTLSYIFKIVLALCLTLFSFILGYMIIHLIRDKEIL